MQHRAAPHHRLVVVKEEADRHQPQVVCDRRHDHLVDDHRLLRDAEHVRDRVPVDVRVEHAHFLAGGGERGGDVHGQRRFADAALARRDRDHPSRRRELDAALLDSAAQARRERRALVRAHHVEVKADGVDAGQRRDVLLYLILEARTKRTACDRECDRHLDPAAVDLDLAHHLELRHGAAQLGIDHVPERNQDLVTGRHAARVPGGRAAPRSASDRRTSTSAASSPARAQTVQPAQR